MPFQIGQIVTCVDNTGPASRNLVFGRQYTIRFVTPGGQAVQLVENAAMWNAARFTEARLEFVGGDEIANAVIAEDIEATQQPVNEWLRYYIMPFYGCCGAALIYARNRPISDAYIKEVLERDDGDNEDFDEDGAQLPSVRNITFIILNQEQHTVGAQNILHDNGFKFLTTSRANTGGVLYTYAWLRHEAPPFTPIERNRAFA